MSDIWSTLIVPVLFVSCSWNMTRGTGEGITSYGLCLPEILFQVSESISCCDYSVLLWKPLFENCNNISNFFVLLKFNVFLDTSSVCGVWLMWYWSENVIMLCGPMFNVDTHSHELLTYRIRQVELSLVYIQMQC